jgi:hypothetical protein
MQYIFVITPHGTHIRDSDGVTGHLRGFSDFTMIHSAHPIMDSDEGYTLRIIEEPVSAPTPVPESLANWRVKAVLDMQGLTPTVDAAIAAMPDSNEKIIISRAWNGNGDVLRHSPTVNSFMAILGLTDAQVDDMFRLADTFNP